MINQPNILIVAGTGRNIGKTVTACRIIGRLAKNHKPVGVKISPHFHDLGKDPKYLFQSENFVIVEEKNISGKDSSRMLQAGAKTVFYVQCKPGHLAGAMDHLLPLLNPKSPVIIESGGLYDILDPGLLVFISGEELKKEVHFRQKSNVIRLASGDVPQFNGEEIHFVNGKITTMLEYKTALDLILSTAQPLPAEKVELQKSLKRVLAEDVFHDMDMPPFNKSAMDGFAGRRVDLLNELEIVETIYAGKLPERKLKENQCYKIMTGAVVPDGADVVFKKEDARLLGDNKVVCQNPKTGNNICYRGEDIKTGEKILEKGTLISPRHLPVLAGAGITNPAVFRRPAITVFATGTELVEPGEKPLSFQIRNSNSAQLLGQISEMNNQAEYGGIIRDDELVLTEKLTNAIAVSDVVILTGGVSVGDFDLVPDVLSKHGFDILVTATAIKPGKPMIFARKGEKYCFGLSGNPVSSFVQFELYVKPFLLGLMEHRFRPEILKLPAAKELKRKKAGRMDFVPVNINAEMEVAPVEFHGSAHINALSKATHLMEVPKEVEKIEKGELVNVRPV